MILLKLNQLKLRKESNRYLSLHVFSNFLISLLLTVFSFISIKGASASVTIVSSACVQGTRWIPNVATVQNLCLSCLCMTNNLSLCKANVLGNIFGGGTTCGTTSIIPAVTTTTARPIVTTLPPIMVTNPQTTTISPITLVPIIGVTTPTPTTTTARPALPIMSVTPGAGMTPPMQIIGGATPSLPPVGKKRKRRNLGK